MKWMMPLIVALAISFGLMLTAQESGEQPVPADGPGEPGVVPEGPAEGELAELVEWLREVAPDRLERLEALKKERPELFKRFAQQAIAEMRKLKELRETDPEEYERQLKERRRRPKMREGWKEGGRFSGDKHGYEKMKKELTDAEIEEVTAWLKDFDPARLKKLEGVKIERPKDYTRFLSECYMEMTRAKDFEKKDPESYQRMLSQRKLDKECHELVDRIKKTEDEEAKERMKTELSSKLAQLFDLRQAEREQEVKRLEEELKRLQENLRKRKESKQEIIDNRIRELLGEKKNLEW